MPCAVSRCEETYDLKPVTFDAEAISQKTISNPKIVFPDVELCHYHRPAFETSKHTVFVHSKPGRPS